MSNWILHRGTKGDYYVDYDKVQLIARSAYYDILKTKCYKRVAIPKKGIIATLMERPFYALDLNVKQLTAMAAAYGNDYASQLYHRIINEQLNPAGIKTSLKHLVKRGNKGQRKYRRIASRSQRQLIKGIHDGIDNGEVALDRLKFIRDTSVTILDLIPIPLSKGLAVAIGSGGNFIENQARVGTKKASAGLALDLTTQVVLRAVPLAGVKSGTSKIQSEAAALVIGTSLNVANTAITKGSWKDVTLKTLVDAAGIAIQADQFTRAFWQIAISVPIKVKVQSGSPSNGNNSQPKSLNMDVDFGTLDWIDGAIKAY